MKLLRMFVMMVFFSTLLLSQNMSSAQKNVSKPRTVSGILPIEDFNQGTPGKNLLNCDTGSFHAPKRQNGNDLIQAYHYSADNDWSLRLDYDLSDKSGMVGYWSRLNHVDLTEYLKNGFLVFFIRGDNEKTSPSRIKVELKTRDESDSIMIGGITAVWSKKRIPLRNFSDIKSWNSMSELVFVLSSDDFAPKDPLKGTLYIDNIAIEIE